MRKKLLSLSSALFVGQLAFVPVVGAQQCLQEEPLACSTPWMLDALTVGVNSYYRDKFAKACVRHDYCYRHGNATYNYSRGYCDDSFYRAMKDTCDNIDWVSVLSLGVSNGGCYAAAKAYHTGVQVAGASHYHGKNAPQCRFDAKHETAHLHKIRADGTIGERVNEYMWTDGWTTVESYTVGATPYVLLMKTHNGKVHIHKPRAESGLLGERIADYNWDLDSNVIVAQIESFWTNAQAYTVGGKPYLFVLKPSNGHARIYNIQSDGKVGSRKQTYDWSSGWTDARVYSVGAEHFLFALKSGTGKAHVSQIKADGTVGSRVTAYDWSDDWSNVEFYKVGGRTYALFLKSKNGKVHLYEVAPTGALGKRIAGYDWSDGWTMAKFYQAGGKTFLFTLKAGNGSAHVSEMNSDGTIGKRVKEYDWRAGWTGAAFYNLGDTPYVLLVKAWAGGKPGV